MRRSVFPLLAVARGGAVTDGAVKFSYCAGSAEVEPVLVAGAAGSGAAAPAQLPSPIPMGKSSTTPEALKASILRP